MEGTGGRNEADTVIIYGAYNGGGMEMNTSDGCTVYDTVYYTVQKLPLNCLHSNH